MKEEFQKLVCDIIDKSGVEIDTEERQKICNDPAVPAQLSGFGIGLRRCFHL